MKGKKGEGNQNSMAVFSYVIFFLFQVTACGMGVSFIHFVLRWIALVIYTSPSCAVHGVFNQFRCYSFSMQLRYFFLDLLFPLNFPVITEYCKYCFLLTCHRNFDYPIVLTTIVFVLLFFFSEIKFFFLEDHGKEEIDGFSL